MIKQYMWTPGGMVEMSVPDTPTKGTYYYRVDDVNGFISKWSKSLNKIRSNLKNTTDFLKTNVMLGHLKVSKKDR